MAEGSLKTPKLLDISALSPDTWAIGPKAMNAMPLRFSCRRSPQKVFMTVIGPHARNMFRMLSPSENDKESLEVFKKNFRENFTPTVSHAYERYKFNCRKQREGETFNEFLMAVRLQARRCQFGDLRTSYSETAS